MYIVYVYKLKLYLLPLHVQTDLRTNREGGLNWRMDNKSALLQYIQYIHRYAIHIDIKIES